MKKRVIIHLLKKGRIRENIIVDEQLNIDLANINQEELLKNVDCPVLILHGNSGETELEGLEQSKTALNFLSKQSKLEIIDGANHSFIDQYDIVTKLTTDWFVKYL